MSIPRNLSSSTASPTRSPRVSPSSPRQCCARAKALGGSIRHSRASAWIKDGGDIITLCKRLGHATPQVTMTTYADDIEEANDNAVRKARVNALFAGTDMEAAFTVLPRAPLRSVQ